MAIVRYNPWSEMDSVQRQINRMFNEVLTPSNSADFGNYSKHPVAELTTTEEALILKLELPGISLEDLDIEATAKSVSISGERKSTVAAEDAENTRSEFSYGSFARMIPLPVRIQNTEVTAEYKDGILYLTLPKAEAEKNKVVKVKLTGESDS